MLWTFQTRIAPIGLKVQVDVMVKAQGEVGVSADVEVDVGVNVSCIETGSERVCEGDVEVQHVVMVSGRWRSDQS